MALASRGGACAGRASRTLGHGPVGRDTIPAMECRPRCGACCTAPSISTPIPGLPGGKPAGMRCPHLLPDQGCALFGDARRPAVCVSLAPSAEMCGTSREQAMLWLSVLELRTRPTLAGRASPH